MIRFLGALRNDPIGHDILDVDELPAPRQEMIDAFRLLIEREPRSRIRDQLKLVGTLLAQYQDDVGPRLRVQAAPAPSDAPEHRQPDTPAIKLIERALCAVEPDRQKLQRLFKQAADHAQFAGVHAETSSSWRHHGTASTNSEWMAR